MATLLSKYSPKRYINGIALVFFFFFFFFFLPPTLSKMVYTAWKYNCTGSKLIHCLLPWLFRPVGYHYLIAKRYHKVSRWLVFQVTPTSQPGHTLICDWPFPTIKSVNTGTSMWLDCSNKMIWFLKGHKSTNKQIPSEASEDATKAFYFLHPFTAWLLQLSPHGYT